MNIVIGYDGSDCARAAVDDLRRCGLPRKANAVIVSACETFLPSASLSDTFISDGVMSHRVAGTLVQTQAEATHAMEEANALAHEGCQRVRALFPDWVTVAAPMVGDPGDAILRKGDSNATDLVVVGSHGRSVLGRFVLGSVSKRVATESRSSVLVARQVVEPLDPATRVIIGVDGSSSAEAAVHAVASRAWPKGSEARVITVDNTVHTTGTIDLQPTAETWAGESNEEQAAKAHAMVDQASDELLASGLRVSTLIKINRSRPQDVLSDEARKWEADCIVVGARGFKCTRDRCRTGRTATALLMHAPCSVEVVRIRQYASE